MLRVQLPPECSVCVRTLLPSGSSPLSVKRTSKTSAYEGELIIPTQIVSRPNCYSTEQKAEPPVVLKDEVSIHSRFLA